MSQQPYWQQQPPYNPYMQPPMPPQPPKRKVRKTIGLGCGLPALLAFAIGVSAAVSNDYDTPAPAPATPSSRPAMTKAVTPARLTADQAAADLAAATGMTDLGDPQDNTGSCATGKGASARWNCEQLITTDTVSVYEFASPTVAAHWTDAMKGVGDWRQVGRFALAWQARDQHLTSEQRRAELVTALRRIAD